MKSHKPNGDKPSWYSKSVDEDIMVGIICNTFHFYLGFSDAV